jgi:hypothetical protein
MFRIPDYVAETRRDGAAAPAARADTSVSRNVTRLGAAVGSAGGRLGRGGPATGWGGGSRPPARLSPPARPRHFNARSAPESPAQRNGGCASI